MLKIFIRISVFVIILSSIVFFLFMRNDRNTAFNEKTVSATSTTTDSDKNVSQVTPEDKTSPISQQIDDYLLNKRYNGTVLIMKNNKVILKKAYGYENFVTKTSLSPDAMIPVGSISKYVTAISILQLSEKGLLSLDDTLAKYYPTSQSMSKIKIRQLLNHTSGISLIIKRHPNMTNSEVIQQVLQGKLKTKPGTHWDYSDANYILLGGIVEKASNQFFNHYVQANIFTPAGITDAYIESGTFSTIQSMKKGTIVNRIDLSGFLGCGGLVTNTDSLFKIDTAIMNGTLLSKASWNKMKQISPPSRAYGFGIYNKNSFYGNRGVYGNTGFDAINLFSSKGDAVILLTNKRDTITVWKDSKVIFNMLK